MKDTIFGPPMIREAAPARAVIPGNTGILPPPSFMDTPAWMQVVERRLEQAAEEVL